ncbi:MAG: hypothetical protein JWR80_6191 [Bradyrhizobium sp.]|nr:hypothetical protein [Bradyrhizobium sp.]
MALFTLTAFVSVQAAHAQLDGDPYSIMRPETGRAAELPEPWLPPKYKSPRGTQERPVTPQRIPEPRPRTTTVPPTLYVPQTGQVLPNLPTINGAGPLGAETSQDRAVRCANQAGIYGSAAGNPSGYVNTCINQ